MTLAGGAIFGFTQGVLIVSFAWAIGAMLAFLASRWVAGGWVQARFASRLAGISAGVARDDGFDLFTLRLVPVVPFFAINLAMGLTPMRVWTFYWVSQLAMLAGTLVDVNAGTQLTAPGKDRILGVTIIGQHAGDLLAEYVLAMKDDLDLNRILGTIHTYPMLAEANKYAAGEWKRAHGPRAVLAWLERFHAWRRG